MKNFRHFHDNEFDTIRWASDLVVFIEIRDGKPIGYTNSIYEKLRLLEGDSTILVGWPGQYRQDVFEFDADTRKRAQLAIEEFIREAA